MIKGDTVLVHDPAVFVERVVVLEGPAALLALHLRPAHHAVAHMHRLHVSLKVRLPIKLPLTELTLKLLYLFMYRFDMFFKMCFLCKDLGADMTLCRFVFG